MIKYFLENKSLNNTLLIFLIIAGIYAYNVIPKEIFPDVALNKIIVTGGYSGASNDNLDKMAVRGIEDEILTISHIDSIDTTITSNRFSIVISLEEDANKITTLNKVKDAISTIKGNLPSDMTSQLLKFLIKLGH